MVDWKELQRKAKERASQKFKGNLEDLASEPIQRRHRIIEEAPQVEPERVRPKIIEDPTPEVPPPLPVEEVSQVPAARTIMPPAANIPRKAPRIIDDKENTIVSTSFPVKYEATRTGEFADKLLGEIHETQDTLEQLFGKYKIDYSASVFKDRKRKALEYHLETIKFDKETIRQIVRLHKQLEKKIKAYEKIPQQNLEHIASELVLDDTTNISRTLSSRYFSEKTGFWADRRVSEIHKIQSNLEKLLRITPIDYLAVRGRKQRGQILKQLKKEGVGYFRRRKINRLHKELEWRINRHEDSWVKRWTLDAIKTFGYDMTLDWFLPIPLVSTAYKAPGKIYRGAKKFLSSLVYEDRLRAGRYFLSAFPALTICAGLGLGSIIGGMTGYLAYMKHRGETNPSEDIKPSNIMGSLFTNSVAFADDGKTKLADFVKGDLEKRNYVTYDKMPMFGECFMAAEDKDFMEREYGVPFDGFLRAMLTNLKNAPLLYKKFVKKQNVRVDLHGGSGGHMQLAENIWGQPKIPISAETFPGEYGRAAELTGYYGSRRWVQDSDPNEILNNVPQGGLKKLLEFLLNQLPVGNTNKRGVYEASKYYFDEEPDQLDIEQKMFIISQIKNPAAYDPFFVKGERRKARIENGIRRTKDNLVNLCNNKLISEEEYKDALKRLTQDGLRFKKGGYEGRQGSTLAGAIEKEIMANPNIEKALNEHGLTSDREKAGLEENLSYYATAGLKFITTINTDAQNAARQSTREILSKAVLMLEPYQAPSKKKFQPKITVEKDDWTYGTVKEISIGKNEKGKIDLKNTYMKVDYGSIQGTITGEAMLDFAVKVLSQKKQQNLYRNYKRYGWNTPKAEELEKIFGELIKVDDVVYTHVVEIEEREKGSDLIFSQIETDRFDEAHGAVYFKGKNGEILVRMGNERDKEIGAPFDYVKNEGAGRMPGSTFKPLLYYAALSAGWELAGENFMLRNSQTPFLENKDGNGVNFWAPGNDHTGKNAVTMYLAGVESDNIASSWLLFHLTDRMNVEQAAKETGLAQKIEETDQQYKERIRDKERILYSPWMDIIKFEKAKKSLLEGNLSDDEKRAVYMFLEYGDPAPEISKNDDYNSVRAEIKKKAEFHQRRIAFYENRGWKSDEKNAAKSERKAQTYLRELGLLDLNYVDLKNKWIPTITSELERILGFSNPSSSNLFVKNGRLIYSTVPETEYEGAKPLDADSLNRILESINKDSLTQMPLFGELPRPEIEKLAEKVMINDLISLDTVKELIANTDSMQVGTSYKLEDLQHHPAFRLRMNMKYFAKKLMELGMDPEKIRLSPGMAIGGAFEMHPSDLVNAYHALFHGEKHKTFTGNGWCVNEIKDRNNRIIWSREENEPEEVPNWNKDAAYAVAQIMLGVGRAPHGTAKEIGMSTLSVRESVKDKTNVGYVNNNSEMGTQYYVVDNPSQANVKYKYSDDLENIVYILPETGGKTGTKRGFHKKYGQGTTDNYFVMIFPHLVEGETDLSEFNLEDIGVGVAWTGQYKKMIMKNGGFGTYGTTFALPQAMAAVNEIIKNYQENTSDSLAMDGEKLKTGTLRLRLGTPEDYETEIYLSRSTGDLYSTQFCTNDNVEDYCVEEDWDGQRINKIDKVPVTTSTYERIYENNFSLVDKSTTLSEDVGDFEFIDIKDAPLMSEEEKMIFNIQE